MKRSSQITSLATSRSAWVASSAPAAAASFEPCVRWNASASPASPATRNSSDSIADSCAACSGPGGSNSCALVVPISCWLHEPVELLLEVGRLDPGRRQRVAQLAPDPLRVACDGRHVGHVVAVGVALLVLLAALRPEQEQDDDQDRERDQAEQAEKRREARARAGPGRAAGGDRGRRGRGGGGGCVRFDRRPPESQAPRRSRTRCRLAVTHRKSRVETVWNCATVTIGSAVYASEGIGPAAANPPEAVSSAATSAPTPGARPRSLPPAAAAGERWLGLRLACARRAHRARSRAEDHPARGQGGGSRGARGRGGVPPAARALPACVRLRLRFRPRLHRLRVRRRPHAARGDARRRAPRRPGGRGGGADPRRPRTCARARDHPPRRQALERAARRGRRHLGAPARLRARAVRRGRDADGGRRRAGHARVHLARAAARRGGLPRERHLGSRHPALGGARRQASVLGRAAAADGRNDRDGSAAAPGRAPRPSEAAPQRDRPCARKRPEEAAARPPRSPRSCAARSATVAASCREFTSM